MKKEKYEMNKDLYIELLEQHVDDLNTAMKIDTVLSLQKHDTEINNLRDYIHELKKDKFDMAVELSRAEVKLKISEKESAKAIRDCELEIGDLQIKHDEEFINLRNDFQKTLETLTERNTRECDLNARMQGKIAELEEELAKLKKENADLRLEVFRLNPPAPISVKEENK